MPDKIKVPDKSKTSDMLEKFRDIILNCLIPGEDVNDMFGVPISNAKKPSPRSISRYRFDQFGFI